MRKLELPNRQLSGISGTEVDSLLTPSTLMSASVRRWNSIGIGHLGVPPLGPVPRWFGSDPNSSGSSSVLAESWDLLDCWWFIKFLSDPLLTLALCLRLIIGVPELFPCPVLKG